MTAMTTDGFARALAHHASALRTLHCSHPGDDMDHPCHAPATAVLLGRRRRDDQPFCAPHAAACRALFERLGTPVTWRTIEREG